MFFCFEGQKVKTLTFALLPKWTGFCICAVVKSRYIGDGHPTFNNGILIMGPYKPLRNWVDEFIPYYMEMSWELIDPIAHMFWPTFQDSFKQMVIFTEA